MDRARNGTDSLSVPKPLVAFMGDDPGYLAWTFANPDGYVLDADPTPGPDDLTIHRATCATITEGNQRYTTDRVKICGPSSSAIDAWLYERLATTSEPCRFCNP